MTVKKYLLILGGFAIAAALYLLLTFHPWHHAEVQRPELPDVSEPVPETETYVSPIDFAALQAENPDIYGWLDIPDTDISYPLLQSQEDDTFYLNHDAYKDYNSAGSLFTEHRYNTNDMTDPVTVVYGHRQNDGSMFGTLQQTFSDPESFAAHRTIVVYLPDRELRYQVRAALPYDNRHILYQYDFYDTQSYSDFLYSVYNARALGINYAEQAIEPDDSLLILSTCLKGNRKNRFLVLAALEQIVPETGTTNSNK